MSRVYRGDSFKLLRSRLPKMLLVFDGHCLMCQERVGQVVARNFFLREADTEANKILFTSTHVQEGKEILRSFPILKDMDTVVFVEKVPSAAGRLLRHNKLRSIGAMPLDAPPEDTDDICVSTKSKACFRVMMRLDRFWVRTLGTLAFYLVPRFVGDAVYDAVAARRRLWGTSEQDAVRCPSRVEGLKERTWNGYARSVQAATVQPKPSVTPRSKPMVSLAPRLK